MTADDWVKGFLDPFALTWVAGGVSAMKDAFTPADTDDDTRPRRTGAATSSATSSATKRTGTASSSATKRTGTASSSATSSATSSGADYAPSMPEATGSVESTVSPWLIAGGLVAVVAAIAYVGTRK